MNSGSSYVYLPSPGIICVFRYAQKAICLLEKVIFFYVSYNCVPNAAQPLGSPALGPPSILSLPPGFWMAQRHPSSSHRSSRSSSQGPISVKLRLQLLVCSFLLHVHPSQLGTDHSREKTSSQARRKHLSPGLWESAQFGTAENFPACERPSTDLLLGL